MQILPPIGPMLAETFHEKLGKVCVLFVWLVCFCFCFVLFFNKENPPRMAQGNQQLKFGRHPRSRFGDVKLRQTNDRWTTHKFRFHKLCWQST